MGLANGGSLSQATGRITIDVSQLQQARAAVQAFAAGTTTGLTGINSSVQAASASFGNLNSSVRNAAGAFGVGFGAVGIVQLGKMAVASAETATAFDRQKVAAEGLAGSQAKLNDLLIAYDSATGGAVDKAQALADVTRLMAVGMADNADELERFVSTSRGAAIAMGRSTQDILGEVQLAVSNQSFRRLDQIGLGIDEVHKRMDDLKASTAGMTTEAAFQEAVIGLLQEKYGALSKSIEALPTGVEHARKALKDFRLEFGEATKGITNFSGEAFANWLDQTTIDLQKATDFLFDFGQALGVVDRRLALPSMTRFAQGMSGIDAGRHSGGGISGGGSLGPTDEQKAVITEWNQKRIDLERQTGEQIADATEQYGSQRATTIAEYEKEIARGAEDYGQQRAKAEANLQEAIADVAIDGARQRERWERDLALSIGEAQRNSAERVADLQTEHDERIGDARADTAKSIAGKQADLDDQLAKDRESSQERIAEIERDYNSDREKAAADHGLRMWDAAMRLDARALFQENARYNLETKVAAEAHQEAISKEQDHLGKTEQERKEAFDKAVAQERANLQERIDAENKSFKKRLDDEAESLAKSIDQQNAANAQRLADAAAADAQRVKDIQDAYDKEKSQAETEYGIRLTRQAQDHDDQLKALDDEHTKRITQIQTHAADEREALDTEFKTQLSALSLQVDGWSAEMTRATNNAMTEYDRWLRHLRESLAQTDLDPRRTQLHNQIDATAALLAKATDPAEIKRLTDLMNSLLDELGKLGAPATATVDASSFGMFSPSAFSVTPASAIATSAMGGSNRSLSMGDINVTVYGAPGQPIEQLADVIDKRILHQVQVAAGRL